MAESKENTKIINTKRNFLKHLPYQRIEVGRKKAKKLAKRNFISSGNRKKQKSLILFHTNIAAPSEARSGNLLSRHVQLILILNLRENPFSIMILKILQCWC